MNEEPYDNLKPYNSNFEVVNENQSVYQTNLVQHNNMNNYDSIKNEKIHRQQLIRHTILSRDGNKSMLVENMIVK
jgi:hypothetical protein